MLVWVLAPALRLHVIKEVFVKTSLLQRVALGALIAALTAPAVAGTQLTGAGSTFVYPFFSKAFYQYSAKNPDVTVNYQSIGSGGGIAQFTQKTVDFGASDVPMSSDELKRAGDPVIQIPDTLGGVAITYNLPGVPNGLRLTRKLVADIFLGNVTNWNDAQISRLNKGVKLPNLPIIAVHRSDGSGTTYIFTDFLSKVSPDWKSKVGTGKSVSWPAASSVGGKGSEGLAGQVANAAGSIGYVELSYALQNHLNTAALQNAAGKFVSCSVGNVAAAAASKPNISATDFSIVNQPGANSYPIAGYSWVMLYQHGSDRAKSKVLHDLFAWLVSQPAQSMAGALDYVPLPSSVQKTAQATLKTMTF